MTHTYEFDTMTEFRGFEQALENRVITVRDRQAADDADVTQAQSAAETMASDMLDRVQRTRHGHRDDQPLTFDFANKVELTVGIVAALAAGHMTDEHGARGDHDQDRVIRMFASMAADFEEMHPDDDVIDGISISMPVVDDDG